ncbi:hypothetical protein CCACVL1_19196, partial [Corchorus capsularis]
MEWINKLVFLLAIVAILIAAMVTPTAFGFWPKKKPLFGCADHNQFCDGVIIQCCNPYRCSLPVVGG